jgi:hypothetical protein
LQPIIQLHIMNQLIPAQIIFELLELCML